MGSDSDGTDRAGNDLYCTIEGGRDVYGAEQFIDMSQQWIVDDQVWYLSCYIPGRFAYLRHSIENPMEYERAPTRLITERP